MSTRIALPLIRICRACSVYALLLALLLAAPAHAGAAPLAAAPAEEDRLTLGLRLAVGKPLGRAWKGVDQAEITDGMLRLQVDLDYRLRSWSVAGAYLALGYGSVGDRAGDACVSELASCAVQSLDVGLQGELRFGEELFDPWLGASLGIEGVIQRIAYGDYTQSIELVGPALALSGGMDLDLGGFSVGPFASAQLGWYTYIKEQEESSSSFTERRLHGVATHIVLWLGVRISFGIGS